MMMSATIAVWYILGCSSSKTSSFSSRVIPGCGAVRPEHPLCPVLGLCPEAAVSVVTDCANPKPARVFGRAFDDFFPEAFFFVVVHIPALP